jgi:hypothetical protein
MFQCSARGVYQRWQSDNVNGSRMILQAASWNGARRVQGRTGRSAGGFLYFSSLKELSVDGREVSSRVTNVHCHFSKP